MRFETSVNSKLKNIFSALIYEKTKRPEIMARSVLGLGDIYEKFIPFVQNYKKYHKGEKLYFVSLDIQRCFDNINQSTLIESLQAAFSEDEYLIRRFIQVKASQARLISQYCKIASSSADFVSFKQFCSSLNERVFFFFFLFFVDFLKLFF